MATKKKAVIKNYPDASYFTEETGIAGIKAYTMKIDSKTGNETYLVTSGTGANKYLIMDYSALKPQAGSKAFAIRNGDDLIFVAKIFNGTKITNTITTTFKNYYAVNTAAIPGPMIANPLAVDANGYFTWYTGDEYYKWNRNNDALEFAYKYNNYHPYTYVNGNITDKLSGSNAEYLFGSKKNDNYNIVNGGDNYIVDEAGNDKYYSKYKSGDSSTFGSIDYAGNDTYDMLGTGTDIQDYAGNDTYRMYDEVDGTIKDYAGNDNYQFYTSEEMSIYDHAGNDSYNVYSPTGMTEIFDYKGNDKYNFVGVSEYTFIDDITGKDTYTFIGSNSTEIYDSGNSVDKYNFTNTKLTNIVDRGGNDVYTMLDEEGKNANLFPAMTPVSSGSLYYETDTLPTVLDFAGNDKYNITSSKNITIYDGDGNDTYNMKDVNGLWVEDQKGNDVYNLTRVEHNTNREIHDAVGNDTYNLNYTTGITVNDDAGKNKFVAKNCTSIDINSNGIGNDTYIVSDFSKNTSIMEYGGNNTFKFDNATNTYVDIDGYDSSVAESKRKNTYTVNNCDIVCLYSNYASNDIYNISNTSNVDIGDYLGNDKYTLKNVSGFVIEKQGGNDVYTITNSNGSILDENMGNEVYKIDKMNKGLIINDDGGKDSLQITNFNKNNIIVYFDQKNGGNQLVSGDVILLDKSNGGYLVIENYFNKSAILNSDGTLNKSDGYIESIYGGKKANKSNLINSYIDGQLEKYRNAGATPALFDEYIAKDLGLDINVFKENISGWLSSNSSGSNGSIVNNLKYDDSNIADLIACFTTNSSIY